MKKSKFLAAAMMFAAMSAEAFGNDFSRPSVSRMSRSEGRLTPLTKKQKARRRLNKIGRK